MTGVLTLVSTPIGNLGDLAPRAVEALEAADLVCCEDTRRTGSLLKQIGVRVDELRRLDDHTEFESIPVILDRLGAGERVVLVSDAGTPGISDPGERLVAAVAEAGIEVTTVPGPVAAIAALVSSGLPSGRFVFEGFLARKARSVRPSSASRPSPHDGLLRVAQSGGSDTRRACRGMRARASGCGCARAHQTS